MDTKPYTNQEQGRHKEQPCKCDEKDSSIKKSISTARQAYCTALKTAKSDKEAAEKAYERSLRIYRKKKKLFEWTENNYRVYRNLDVCLDTELKTSSASLTDNVKNYNALSTTLYTNLKAIVTGIKDLKTKVSALRDQASNLENYKNDQCNATQWTLLTGKNMENCKGDTDQPPPHERPEACKDADHIYHELITVPKKVLVFDVDSLLQSSADVVGIQTFSNISVLTAQQDTLSKAADAFVAQIQAALKARVTDLTAVQNDLVAAVQDCTKAGVDEFNKISIYSGAYHTIEVLCKPDCNCVKRGDEHNHRPRLEDCECKICDICKEVKNTYRGEKKAEPARV